MVAQTKSSVRRAVAVADDRVAGEKRRGGDKVTKRTLKII